MPKNQQLIISMDGSNVIGAMPHLILADPDVHIRFKRPRQDVYVKGE